MRVFVDNKTLRNTGTFNLGLIEISKVDISKG